MIKSTLPTQAQIKEILHYDFVSGDFRWRFGRKNNQIKPWDLAGTMDKKGYIVINFGGKTYKAHRLAWVYMTGEQPKDQIDHIDGVRNNNAFANLREATNKQNMENVTITKRNKSGFRGVFFQAKNNKWVAQVIHNQKGFYLGAYDSAEKAHFACVTKRAELFTHNTGRDTLSQAAGVAQ